MIAKWSDTLLSIAACPRCRSRISPCAGADRSRAYRCTNPRCGLAEKGFPRLNEQPVLIDFDGSILDRAAIVTRNWGQRGLYPPAEPAETDEPELPRRLRA